MVTKIAILGLGQIGTSIGLALAEHKEIVHRIGYDKNPETAKQAQKAGAVDELKRNQQAAVNDADLVILSLPLDEIRPVLEVIAGALKDAAVVMDTAPVKRAVAQWAQELLPAGRYYVGLAPVLNPKYLHEERYGFDAASADLFHNGMFAIATPPNTDSRAIKMAADLARLVGAAPLFIDMVELDSMMTAVDIIPRLLGAALLNVTQEQPSWRDARKLAGRAYAEVSGPVAHLGPPEALVTMAMANQDNTLRILDSVIAVLQSLREDIANQSQDNLVEKLSQARTGRDVWWRERQGAEWMLEDLPPSRTSAASDVFGNLLRFGRRTRQEED